MTTTTTAAGTETHTYRSSDKILTYCAFRLGDNLAHLHFLRALAKAHPSIHFQHAAIREYLPQMIEVVADLPNVSLRDIMSCRKEAGINAWKNAAGFWEKHELKSSYAEFMLVWFDVLAKRMGLLSPFTKPEDLLFDYPALQRNELAGKVSLHPQHVKFVEFDFLFVNSLPMSSQWKGMNVVEMTTLIQTLAQRYDVVTTRAAGLNVLATETIPGFSVTDIGAVSLYAKRIIAVSTGPSWPTLNVWNKGKEFYALMDTERLGIHENIIQCKTIADCRTALKSRGIL